MNHFTRQTYIRTVPEQLWGDSIEFYIFERTTDGSVARVCVGKTVEMEPMSGDPDTRTQPAPTFKLYKDAAQSLMDALWHAGIRPAEGTGSAGQLKAVEKHLEDMRSLVFSPMQGKGPKIDSVQKKQL